MTRKNFGVLRIVINAGFVCLMIFGCSFLNDYQDSGQLSLKGLKAPVKVMRDEKGMAYIYAQNADDAFMAHGFVTAQDRLFQMEFLRRLAQGRISEFAGQQARALSSGPLAIGSNNWAVSGKFSKSGKPIVANDPHMDARILPGPFYPCALITPDFRFIGINVPGVEGMVAFRNEYIAAGITNAYGDAQDLYVETVDPNNPENYLEGGSSIPFTILEENLSIKDKQAPDGRRQETIKIKLTRRGPVISDIFPRLNTDKVLTLRWASFETIQSEIGLDRLMLARSVSEFRAALKDLNFIALNFVFADVQGNLGWQTSGKLPIRLQKDSTLPYEVKSTKDNWIGWIPFEEMPHAINPERG